MTPAKTAAAMVAHYVAIGAAVVAERKEQTRLKEAINAPVRPR